METCSLGKTGLRVSKLGLGTGIFSQRDGTSQEGTSGKIPLNQDSLRKFSVSEQEVYALIQKALDEGITLFEVAPFYGQGRSLALLSKALGRRRQDAVILLRAGVRTDRRGRPVFTNSGVPEMDLSEKYLTEVCHQSLRELNTDYIDLFDIQGIDFQTLLRGECFITMEKLQREGKIRYRSAFLQPSVRDLEEETLGPSAPVYPVHPAYSVHPALLAPLIDVLRTTYHLLIPWTNSVLEEAKKNGLGTIVCQIFCRGLLSGAYREKEDLPARDPRRNFFSEEGYEAIFRAVHDLSPLVKNPRAGYTFEEPRSLAQALLQFYRLEKNIDAFLLGVRTHEQLTQNLSALALEPLSETERQGVKEALRFGLPQEIKNTWTGYDNARSDQDPLVGRG